MEEKNTKRLVPPLRFRGFTDDWQQRRLGEIGVTYTGLSGKSKADFGHGEAQYVTYMNVYSNPIASSTGIDLIETDQNQNEVQKGDIFFTTSSETPEEVGLSSVWLHEGITTYLNSFCFGYRPIVDLDSYFMASLLRSPRVRKEFVRLAQGISRFNISKKKAMDITPFFPSLPEQEKIGEFFIAMDDLIGAKEAELEKRRQIKAALLEVMFPDEEGSTPGQSDEALKSVLGAYPELELRPATPHSPRLRFRSFSDDWTREKLGSLFILRNGYTPSKNNPDYWKNGTIPWFRMEDIREHGHILKDSIQHVTESAVKVSGLFPKDCFILSTTATIGEHAWIIADSLANQQFTVLCTVNRWNTLNTRYFHQYCFLLGDWCRKNVNVGGLDAVNIDDLKEHLIPFPSLAEQERIGDFFRAQDESIAALREQIDKLWTIKQACLEQMFV